MMTYSIENSPGGGAKVYMTQPVEIAAFKSELHAHAFVAMLQGAERRHVERGQPTEEEPDVGQDRPVPTPATAQTEGDCLEVWDSALARIGDGESVKEVAKDLGLPFAKLRGRWAAHVGKLKRGEKERDLSSAADAAAPVTIDRGPQELVEAPRRAAGSSLAFNADQDVEIATTDDEALQALADKWGRPVLGLTLRKRAMEAQVAREMSE